MIDVSDLFVFLGIALVAVGFGLISWPAAIIAVGILLFTVGMLSAWRSSRRRGP